ncbi:MAG: hypothetical protein LQ338_000043 [Usnochroma carphineum]|nr:MAG: hypothetical protein LQ338_000043 [Usnochroma carphineum]
MNAIIQAQLDRVEAALNTLISSIESYNPSVPAAIDLLAADTELQKGVEQLAQHQAHHARILRLRSSIEAQDQQRRSTLALLAETRKDLLSTPATTFPETSRSVPYTELLDYATRISRYTIPPTSREPPPPPKQVAVADTNANIVADAATPVNGIGDAVTEAREANAIANGEITGSGEGKGVGEKSLEQNEVQWLNPLAQIPFTPWPTEDVMKRGALGQIQVMLEQGVDPGAGDATGKGLRGGHGEVGEEHAQMGDHAGEALRETGGGRLDGGERKDEDRRREEKPKVFKGLDLDEDSDDE